MQFDLAMKFNRTVTIHCVRAYGEMLKFFKKYHKSIEESKKNKAEKENKEQSYQGTPIIMHSYGGSK